MMPLNPMSEKLYSRIKEVRDNISHTISCTLDISTISNDELTTLAKIKTR